MRPHAYCCFLTENGISRLSMTLIAPPAIKADRNRLFGIACEFSMLSSITGFRIAGATGRAAYPQLSLLIAEQVLLWWCNRSSVWITDAVVVSDGCQSHGRSKNLLLLTIVGWDAPFLKQDDEKQIIFFLRDRMLISLNNFWLLYKTREWITELFNHISWKAESLYKNSIFLWTGYLIIFE